LLVHLSSRPSFNGVQVNEKPLMLLYTLADFLRLLPALDFVRIHRSTVINLARVEYVEKDHLVIEGEDLNIGKTYRASLLSSL
jgi:DNA-binding LytR/AlgR family response regulator